MPTPQYKLRSFNCSGCGVFIEKRCPAGSHFCTLECYRASKRPQRLTGQSVRCGSCDTEFYVSSAQIKVVNFCSVVCHNAHQSRNKTIHNCKICDGEFRWSPSRSKAQNPTYCSIKCRNLCSDWKLNAVIAGNLKQQHMKSPSSLEVAGYALLDSMGVAHERQVLIAEKFTVDTVVSGKLIIIQWDGDYWHGYRAANDNTPLQPRQEKRARLDRSQDAYMAKCGYMVLRFWEHEVKHQLENVRETIARAIQQAAA